MASNTITLTVETMPAAAIPPVTLATSGAAQPNQQTFSLTSNYKGVFYYYTVLSSQSDACILTEEEIAAWLFGNNQRTDSTQMCGYSFGQVPVTVTTTFTFTVSGLYSGFA